MRAAAGFVKLLVDVLAFHSATALGAGTRHCVFSAWTEWTQCTDGLAQRSRMISVAATLGGSLCNGALVETKQCGTQSERDGDGSSTCVVSQWSAWSACSVSCDGGQMMRQRSMNGKFCEPATLSEVAGCNSLPCSSNHLDCELGDWADWSTCIFGLTNRSRQIRTEAKGEGMPCHASLREIRGCDASSCPMSQWSPWSVCSASCGPALHWRDRSQDKGCVGLAPTGALSEVALCEGMTACEVQDNEQESVPVDCLLSDWQPWSRCQRAEPNQSKSRNRSRDIVRSNSGGGLPCQGQLTQQEACKCILSEWSDWSPCAGELGQRLGQALRSREVVETPCLVWYLYGNLEEVKPCYVNHADIMERRLEEEAVVV
mmetsp:Transcript_41882/g.76103  ORF Transcript_41882/g.76103 Transcript_41882/m.76103 type:complete len:373 (-) Transcript_41882:29-1147(-)